jgi:hypothetical protein
MLLGPRLVHPLASVIDDEDVSLIDEFPIME